MTCKGSIATDKMGTPDAKQTTKAPTDALRNHPLTINMSGNMQDLPKTEAEVARLHGDFNDLFDFDKWEERELESGSEERPTELESQRSVDTDNQHPGSEERLNEFEDQQNADTYNQHPGSEEKLNKPEDQRNVDSDTQHQPDKGWDITQIRVEDAARALTFTPTTVPSNMQPLYAHHLGAPSDASAGQPLFAPAAPNIAPNSNNTQNQDAPPATVPAVQQLAEKVSTATHVTAIPLIYLSLKHGRPPQALIWPANVEIGLVEICTFCPAWFKIPEAAARAIRNEWTAATLGKAQLHALGTLDDKAWKRAISKIQKEITVGCRTIDGTPPAEARKQPRSSLDFRVNHDPQSDLTTNAWQFLADYGQGKRVKKGHLPLSLIYQDVLNWPVGNDRLLMTQCLEFARNNELLGLDSSHWDWIIQSRGLTAPLAPVGVNRDRDALERLNANVPDP